MNKKILSLLLAVVMIIGILPTSTVLALPSTSLTLKANKTDVKSGDLITFTVTLQHDGKLNTLQAEVDIPRGLSYVENSLTTIDKAVLGWDEFSVIEGKVAFFGYGSVSFESSTPTEIATFQCTVDDTANLGIHTIDFKEIIAEDQNYNTKSPTAVPANVNVTFSNKIYDSGLTLDKYRIYLDTKYNKTATLTATVYPDNASFKNVKWSSSNPRIATVQNGVITAVNLGSTTITATSDSGYSSQCTVSVTRANNSNAVLTLNADKTHALIGDEIEFSIYLQQTGSLNTLQAELNIPDGLTYVEDSLTLVNKSVLGWDEFTAISGKLGFFGYGSNSYQGESPVEIATFKCRVNNNAAYNQIVSFSEVVADDENYDSKQPVALSAAVFVDIPATDISLNVSEINLDTKNERYAFLTPQLFPENTTDSIILWSSSDPSVAIVRNGLVDAIGNGTATITATTADGKYTAECIVTVIHRTTTLTITADKTLANPSDEILFSVNLQQNGKLNTLQVEFDIPAGLTYIEDSLTLIDKSFLGWDELTDIVGKVGFFGYGSQSFQDTTSIEIATFKCVVNENATGILSVGTTEFIADDNTYSSQNPIYVSADIEICKHEQKTFFAAKIANCQEGGWNAYYTCDKCNCFLHVDGKTILDSIPVTDVDTSNHTNPVNYPAVPATCISLGNNSYTKCEDCKAVVTGSEEQFYGEHNYGTLIPAVSEKHTSTELAPAIDAHYHCSVCDKYFTTDKTETTLEELTGTTPSHNGGNYLHDEDYHWKECACGAKVDHNKHTGGKATTTSKAICEICGVEYGNFAIQSINGTIAGVGSDGEEVSISLKQNGSEVLSQTSNNGSFSFANIADGEYEMTFSKENYAPRTYTVTVDGGEVVQDVKLHRIGDIDGNGKVNISDVGKANAHAKNKKILEDYDFSCADLNGDGRVNISDVGKMNAHAKNKKLLW